jgi:uncharacterized protein YndB with AHSA1/START domain
MHLARIPAQNPRRQRTKSNQGGPSIDRRAYAIDPDSAQRLWELSEKLVNAKLVENHGGRRMSRLHRYVVSRHVAADPTTVWNVISDHTGMTQWTPFRKAVLEVPGHPFPNGVGAVRALHLLGPPTREQILDFEPPHRLRYRLLSGLPFSDYVGEITVDPEGTGTRLSTELRFRTRIPGTQLFGPVAIRVATRSAARLAEKRARDCR